MLTITAVVVKRGSHSSSLIGPQMTRLTWLEKEFLPYLDQWEQSVLSRDVEEDNT